MSIDINLFNINHYLAKIGPGRCLISEPFSPDSYFGRSVVLITEHSPSNGTLGYILNKPIEVPFNDLLPDFPTFAGRCYIGGPVNPETVHYLHTRPDLLPESSHVNGNVYWGGSFVILKNLIATGQILPREIKFFLGYSGWSPNQLHEEIDSKYWVVSDINARQIMEADNTTWKKLLTELGESYTLWANAPLNPAMN